MLLNSSTSNIFQTWSERLPWKIDVIVGNLSNDESEKHWEEFGEFRWEKWGRWRWESRIGVGEVWRFLVGRNQVGNLVWVEVGNLSKFNQTRMKTWMKTFNLTLGCSFSSSQFLSYFQTEQFTVLWILFAVIVLGNTAVLVTLFINKSRKSRMNFFIRHLAIAGELNRLEIPTIF
jgi:hypothetical protein